MQECLMCGKETDRFRYSRKETPIGYVCDRCWRKDTGGRIIRARNILDYCAECGRPLTVDMKKGRDWFKKRNIVGESIALCKECNVKVKEIGKGVV